MWDKTSQYAWKILSSSVSWVLGATYKFTLNIPCKHPYTDIYNYPKIFLDTWRKVTAATKVPSPQARAWYSVGVRATAGSQNLLAPRKWILGLTSLKGTEMRDGKVQDISQPNKKDHFLELFHPPVSNYSRDVFFYLPSWESICWYNESQKTARKQLCMFSSCSAEICVFFVSFHYS